MLMAVGLGMTLEPSTTSCLLRLPVWSVALSPLEVVSLGDQEYAAYVCASRDSVLLNELDKAILDLLSSRPYDQEEIVSHLSVVLDLDRDECLESYVRSALQQLATVSLISCSN